MKYFRIVYAYMLYSYYQKQICSFVRPKGKSLRLDLMNMQLQDNLNDCGLFAISCATELVYERDPCVAHFQPEVIREHLMKCFQNKKLTPFPLKKNRIWSTDQVQ